MTMRKVALALVLAGLPACDGPRPEFVLAVDTDMPPPPDGVDSILIKTIVEDSQSNLTTVSRGYDPANGLPATLALLAPLDPSAFVKIQVIGLHQDSMGQEIVRIRTVFPTFPADHVAGATATLSYLCAGSGVATNAGTDYELTGSCVKQDPPMECVGGWCQEPSPSGELPAENDAGCFDTVGCFERGAALDIERDLSEPWKDTCTFSAAGIAGDDLNVALVTTNPADGTCGPHGCYVPLNDTDWVISGGKIHLPCEACKRLEPTLDCKYDKQISGRKSFEPLEEQSEPSLSGVKVARCTPKKTANLSLCSIRSKPGPGTPTPFAVTLARSQPHPVSIAVSKGDVYWINSGTFEQDGASTSTLKSESTVMRSVRLGAPAPIATAADTGHSFRDLAIVGSSLLWTEAALDSGPGQVWCAPLGGAAGAGKATPVTGQPESIAGHGSTLFWTELDGIRQATVTSCGLSEVKTLPLSELLTRPSDIAASSDSACWTGAGGVQCSGPGIPDLAAIIASLPASSRPTRPQGIAIHLDPSEKPVFGAFVDFDSGAVYGVDLVEPTNPTRQWIVNTGDHPSGVTIDDQYVYWTHWGDGTVYRVLIRPEDPSSPLPELLAEDQDHPGAIVADDRTLYWVNEGSIYGATGSIAARSK